jgi:hypothetical protein
MTRIKIMGLCLIAVFAMAAVAAASASAAPTYYECAKAAKVGKLYTGNSNNSTCTEANAKGEGKYNLQPGRGKDKAFKGKGGAATLHTPAVGGIVECGASKDEGYVSSSFTGQEKVKVTFTKCKSESKACNSPGAKSGEIKTNPLSGTLGYISKSGPVVGVSLTGEAGHPSAEFECGTGAGALKIVTTGAVIGEITGDTNKISKEATDSFSVTGGGQQSVTSFEGGPTEVLESSINGSPELESGEATTTVNKGEALEIKA